MTSRNRNIVRAPRRARQWALQTGQNGTVAAASHAGAIAIDLFTSIEAELGMTLNNVTLSAIRLAVGCQFFDASTVGDRVMLHWGVTWVTQDAFDAGAVSMPEPNADNADWMAHGAVLLVSEATGIHMPRGGQFLVTSDSMRKQRENNSLPVIIFQASLSEHSIQIFLGGRVLYLLP